MPPTVTSTNQRAFAAGQSVEVKCRTSGSRPTPSITWWKGNKQIAPHLSAIMVSCFHDRALILPAPCLRPCVLLLMMTRHLSTPSSYLLISILPVPDPIHYVCRSCRHHLSNLIIGAGVNRWADISLCDFG